MCHTIRWMYLGRNKSVGTIRPSKDTHCIRRDRACPCLWHINKRTTARIAPKDEPKACTAPCRERIHAFRLTDLDSTEGLNPFPTNRRSNPPNEETMFTGFTEKTIDFMWNIRANNEKSWFEANKENYKQNFQSPMKELGLEVFDRLNAEYGKGDFVHKLSRIYRDARRVRDGRPYRDSLWFSIERPSQESEESSGVLTFWFELHPEGWTYGLGYYAAKAATMEKFRASVDSNPKKFEKLVDMLNSQDQFKLEGEEYARVKQAPTPKTQEWYNKKSFSLIHHGEIDQQLFSPKLVEHLVEGYKFLMPFYDYFIEAEKFG